MLDALLDLDIGLINIFSCLLRILLCMLDNRVLGLDKLRHIRKHGSQLGEGGLDTLKFIVTRAHGTENRSSLARSVALELQDKVRLAYQFAVTMRIKFSDDG